MTVRIELPDDQAAALRTKAAEQGLTLEDWFQKLASVESSGQYHASERTRTPEDQHGSVVEEMRKLRARIEPDPEGWTTRDYINYGRR